MFRMEAVAHRLRDERVLARLQIVEGEFADIIGHCVAAGIVKAKANARETLRGAGIDDDALQMRAG